MNEVPKIALNDNLPIGSIIIWAGDLQGLPENWRVCNGTSLYKNEYSTLYSILGENWINDGENSNDFFNIPDLRGVFLRGVNDDRNDAFKDPELNKRVRLRGDSTLSNDSPGSYQPSSIAAHTHPFIAGGGSSGPRDAVSIDTTYNSDHGLNPPITGPQGSAETRPVNAYVHFIIKVKNTAA
jgi:microcystin-dependent protein